ncbi:Gfo/Idh/MocA family protein [Kosmotoga pacifica]|uniref:Oxidoreductase n=1 Tax=Kosmotoga pacifica TaxID=1330330 RepID=A0A0G2Z726_9BACT|nr:Gfo/Idh/MocA family oxidoreductase [Kosmotoga pacifica]AKI97405.1 oxidoreductase [Kosmotoga pacifica]
MKKVSISIIGAGNRGYEAYGKLLLNREDVKVVAVAEPDRIKRERFSKEHNVPKENQFASWEELLSREQLSDGLIIATPDRLHVEPAIKAAKFGYTILLEKPIAQNPEEILKMLDIPEVKERVTIAHVLRYTPFFKTLKGLLDNGEIGTIIGIEHIERIGFFHFAHSYVRGNWRKKSESGPSILTKSCHDADILHWLVGERCEKVISLGELYHFSSENKPAEAAERCLDCSLKDSCPYSATRIYLTGYTGWPVSVITTDLSYEGRLKALREGPYGRCVYSSDNDVVDHQATFFYFRNGVVANFTMTAFSHDITRQIRIHCSHGEIYGDLDGGFIELNIFGKERKEVPIEGVKGGHSGGDEGLVEEFVALLKGEKKRLSTAFEDSVHSHMMAFAAEKSREQSGIVVPVTDFLV